MMQSRKQTADTGAFPNNYLNVTTSQVCIQKWEVWPQVQRDGQGADIITLSGFVYRKHKTPTSEGYYNNYSSTASLEIKE